jgi:hypothetical protein
MSMVERVARAIWLASTSEGWTDDPDERQSDATGMLVKPADYADKARAAIAAMREPTDEQRNAYFALKRRFYPPAMAVFMDAEWERMIDAALMEPESPAPQERQSDPATPR